MKCLLKCWSSYSRYSRLSWPIAHTYSAASWPAACSWPRSSTTISSDTSALSMSSSYSTCESADDSLSASCDWSALYANTCRDDSDVLHSPLVADSSKHLFGSGSNSTNWFIPGNIMKSISCYRMM